MSTQVAREVIMHAGLAHESIVAMYAAWKDRSHVFIVMEWAPMVSELNSPECLLTYK